MVVSQVRRMLILVLELVIHQAREVLRGTSASSNASLASSFLMGWNEPNMVAETKKHGWKPACLLLHQFLANTRRNKPDSNFIGPL